KTTRHFLTAADLGKCPVLCAIEVNLERFSVRSDIHLRFHSNPSSSLNLNLFHPNDLADRFKARKLRRSRRQERRDYIRTCSSLLAGSQPRRLFGSAA